MLIVIEGLDGAGKSTQVNAVRNYIESKGIELEYMHFPRYDGLYGSLIARFLRGEFGSLEAVHPQLVALLFAEDRHDAAAQMEEWLAEGKWVLLDRYVYSNIAYQCSKLQNMQEAENLRKWIFDTEYGLFGIPKPDVNIFLDVPISFVDKKLKEEREGDERDYLNGKKDIHEADIAFQKRVRSFYLSQTELDPDFHRVNCASESGDMLPPDEIFARIKAALGI